MMNKFIEIEMQSTMYGIGGSFWLDNFKALFYNIEVEIDTGCTISTIPFKRLKVSNTLCRVLKKADIIDCTSYFLNYGIESGGLKHKGPNIDEEKMDCPAMKFEHGISDLMISRVKFPPDKICLNYDRSGNILIGMDILKVWDIHIGVSRVTGKGLFLACPKESMCEKYYGAWKIYFNLLI